jgi:hypothetical protein
MKPTLSIIALVSLFAAGGDALADRAPPPPERAGDASDAKDPSDASALKDPSDAAAPAPEGPSVWRLEDNRPDRLPDGVFLGSFEVDPEALPDKAAPASKRPLSGAQLRVTIVGGRVTEAILRRSGGLVPFDLFPVESGDAIQMRLQGSSGSEYIRLNGAFFDAERGAGRFDGVLDRHKTSGSWLIGRR